MSLKVSSILPKGYSYKLHEAPLARLERFEGLSGLFKGWVLSFFDYTLRIHDQTHNTYFYLRTKDIARELCSIQEGPIWKKHPSTSEKINRLVLENLNPLTGEEVTVEKVAQFFIEFRSTRFIEKLKHCPDSNPLVTKRLERFKHRHLRIISLGDFAVASGLKPGDLLFRKSGEKDGSFVRTAQKHFAPLIWGNKERQGYKFTHVAIYIGNGKIAEADYVKKGSGVHIRNMDHPGFSLYRYVVTRAKDHKLAEQAASIAATIAKDHSTENPRIKGLEYNRILAGRSIFHTPSFGPGARFRYLKQYMDDREKELPTDFMAGKKFFCSYFVGYCYQIAESRKIMPAILEKNDIPNKGCSPFDKSIRHRLWARFRSWRLWNTMSEKIKLTFDPMRTTPHELRNFVLSKPDLFQDIYLTKAFS